MTFWLLISPGRVRFFEWE